MNKLFLFLFLFFLIGCIELNNESVSEDIILQPFPLRFEFFSSDGVELIGLMHEAKTNKAIIFLHSLNSSKEVYSDLIKEFNAKGFTVISLDLRGHGESVIKNNEHYFWVNFNEKDFFLMENDLKEIYEYLLNKNLTEIYLVGAGISANTVINFASKNEVNAIAVFSPAFEYRGINSLNSIELISVPVFIACSRKDLFFNECSELNDLIPSEKKTHFIYEEKHAEFILEDEFIKKNLINWIQNH